MTTNGAKVALKIDRSGKTLLHKTKWEMDASPDGLLNIQKAKNLRENITYQTENRETPGLKSLLMNNHTLVREESRRDFLESEPNELV